MSKFVKILELWNIYYLNVIILTLNENSTIIYIISNIQGDNIFSIY